MVRCFQQDRSKTHLTERERSILALLAAGQRNREIAEQLQVSIKTVEFHVGQILDKLDVRSRAEAVGKAITLGLVNYQAVHSS